MSENAETQFRIGEAARLVGVSVSTLRLWEAQGLIDPQRLPSGQRLYSPANMATLREVVRLRQHDGLNAAAIRGVMPELSARTPVGDQTAQVGQRLRTLRRAAGKTLGDIASAVGVATSTLSTFERTSSGLSFKALSDLAQFFGTSVSTLSGADDSEARSLVRSGEWRTWPQTTPGLTVQLMAEGRNQMDCHRFVLEPGTSSEGAYRHDGEEFIHVLTGRLEVVLDRAEVYDLLPGDTLYFASNRQHSWANRHDGTTVLIWINTPPTF